MEVVQPTLRLRRRRDGTWNLEGLLADPWPGPWIETPPITIQNATLELIPDEEPASIPIMAPAGPMLASRASGAAIISVSGSGRSRDSPAAVITIAVAFAGSADERHGGSRSPAILRDVSLKIVRRAMAWARLRVRGHRPGRHLRRLRLKGTVDLITGSITLEGELTGLTLSETLRRRVPRGYGRRSRRWRSTAAWSTSS